MQFYREGYAPAYGAQETWQEALKDKGFNQMKYLKELMLRFPFFERIPDQSVIAGTNGERYDRQLPHEAMTICWCITTVHVPCR